MGEASTDRLGGLNRNYLALLQWLFYLVAASLHMLVEAVLTVQRHKTKQEALS